MSRTAYLARLERERLLTLERRGKARAEARAVAGGVAETVALIRSRGAAIEEPGRARGERDKPYRRLSGLEWLVRRGRLTPAQQEIGEAYGVCYRRVRGDLRIGSTLDVKPGLGMTTGGPLTAVIAQAEANFQAAEALAAYRRRLCGQPALISACDLVCGEELTPREAASKDRDAHGLESVLAVALDLLAEVVEA